MINRVSSIFMFGIALCQSLVAPGAVAIERDKITLKIEKPLSAQKTDSDCFITCVMNLAGLLAKKDGITLPETFQNDLLVDFLKFSGEYCPKRSLKKMTKKASKGHRVLDGKKYSNIWLFWKTFFDEKVAQKSELSSSAFQKENTALQAAQRLIKKYHENLFFYLFLENLKENPKPDFAVEIMLMLLAKRIVASETFYLFYGDDYFYDKFPQKRPNIHKQHLILLVIKQSKPRHFEVSLIDPFFDGKDPEGNNYQFPAQRLDRIKDFLMTLIRKA